MSGPIARLFARMCLLALAPTGALQGQTIPGSAMVSTCAAVEPGWSAAAIQSSPGDFSTSLSGSPLRSVNTVISSPSGSTGFSGSTYDYSGSVSADSGAARSGTVQLQLQQGSNYGATTRSEFHITAGAYTELNLFVSDAESTNFSVTALDSAGQPLAATHWHVASYEQNGVSPADAANPYSRLATRLDFLSSNDAGFPFQDDDAIRIRFDAMTLASAAVIVVETRRDAVAPSNGDWIEYMLSACTARDYGDAPASYGAAWHAIGTAHKLGNAAPDADAAAQPTADADGDDVTGSDDEDGVTIPALTQGNPASIPVSATRPASLPGYLSAWIDCNGDGDFDDADEQIAADQQIAGGPSGTIAVALTVPARATTARTYARFRWSSATGFGPAGPANDGEVEDYALTIAPAARLAIQKDAAISPISPLAYAVPGSHVLYTITVANQGEGQTDGGTLLIVDTLPAEIAFHNGDPDGPGPLTDPVAFDPGTSGLAFAYASDVRFSNAATRPIGISDCAYTPVADADPSVRHICVAPQGTMSVGNPTSTFSIRYRGVIR